MAEQPKKTRVLTLRVTEEDFAEIDKKLKATGMTTSEFLRDVFLNSKVTFNVKESRPVDYQRLLFFYNKASNNINQLAHNVNAANRRGLLSESVYLKWLNKLASIESRFLTGISNVD